MIRTIFGLLFAILYLICGIPVLFVEWIIGKFNKPLMDTSSLHMVQWALATIGKICGVRLTVIGKENIPKDQAVLYVCNHRSYFDIILGYSLMPGLTGYISKDNLEKVPLLNIWMKRLYCLFLNRKDIKQGVKTILTAIEYIKQGVSICIFPEGTRNKGEEGTLLEFKEGSFKIANKTGCPVVPMAISNSADVIYKHMPKVTPCHVIIEYGEPIYPKELPKEQKKALPEITRSRIQAMLDQHEI